MRTSKRAVLTKPGTIETWDGDIPTASGADVLVAVDMAGVCGTDHHFLVGEVDLPGPVVLGHEGVGRIVELGPDAATDYAGQPIAVDDLVYWLPLQPCHRCHACTVLEDATLCPSGLANFLGDAMLPPVCSYSEYALLNGTTTFFRIPPDTPPETVIALGCALPTMLHGMERIGGIGYGQSVVVQGAGPVGLAAVLLARLAGAGDITVIGSRTARLDAAKRLGATTTIDRATAPDEDARVAAIMESTYGRGADVVIEAAGQLPAFAEGVRLAGSNGRYLIAGLWSAPGTAQLEPRTLNNMNLRIIGSTLARPRHMHQAVAVARAAHTRFPLAGIISRRYGLDESQQAVEAVKGRDTVKSVIVPR